MRRNHEDSNLQVYVPGRKAGGIGRYLFVLAVLAALTASSAGAHCKGQHDPARNGGVCPPHDEGGVGGDLTTEGAVGHAFVDLLCDGDDSGKSGDFWDIGTTAEVCELLECTTSNSQVVCGTRSHDPPRLQIGDFDDDGNVIGGLFLLWDDPASLGEPSRCFPGGNIVSTFHVTQAGSGNDYDVTMFWPGFPDPTLERCEGTGGTLVKYFGKIEGCFLDSGPFPPAVKADETVIGCNGAPVEIKTEGGGRVAKKCGCTASGFIGPDTLLRFRVISP